MDIDKLKFAVSCSSNMNRSMEAHSFMQKRGFNIESYGSGNQVKLPGTAADKPNCYEFGKATVPDFTTSSFNSTCLFSYTQNGLLNMLDRNRRIKPAPQKFQHEDKEFDVIICLEERVYDQAGFYFFDFDNHFRKACSVSFEEEYGTGCPKTCAHCDR
ncbi:unnamed protein product [Cylicostephanus goldi]|uniref:RNA polymerase II subunit A C-terminal domain phosphatase SSU72 n=1 Tax=Cylicostephanus goldi TaxID=71465 RepID=A0A3P6T390_CYLGO|nr:unnamed protein product [Cylicostephanus goldi]